MRTELPAPRAALPEGGRLQSLDAFGGLIMFTLLCGGIFQSLNGLSGWNVLARQNEHFDWAGCTRWDLIQPSFAFTVGVAFGPSSPSRSSNAAPRPAASLSWLADGSWNGPSDGSCASPQR